MKALAQEPYLRGEGKNHKLSVKPKEKKEEFLLRRKFKERQKDLGFLYKGLCRAPKSIRVYGIWINVVNREKEKCLCVWDKENQRDFYETNMKNLPTAHSQVMINKQHSQTSKI